MRFPDEISGRFGLQGRADDEGKRRSVVWLLRQEGDLLRGEHFSSLGTKGSRWDFPFEMPLVWHAPLVGRLLSHDEAEVQLAGATFFLRIFSTEVKAGADEEEDVFLPSRIIVSEMRASFASDRMHLYREELDGNLIWEGWTSEQRAAYEAALKRYPVKSWITGRSGRT